MTQKYLHGEIAAQVFLSNFARFLAYQWNIIAPATFPVLLYGQLSSRSSLKHFAQTFFPWNTVTSLPLSQKMQLGRYFFKITADPST